jgi:hypothetical protein
MLGFSAGALAALATAAVAAVAAGQLRPDPTSHQSRTTSPPALATPIHLQQLQLPKHLPTIPEEEPP